MRTGCVSKGLVCVVIFLFIGMSSASSVSNTVEKTTNPAAFDGNTLYVGGSGSGNYSSIQDAIDAASSGDTVFVYNGTYYENVAVDKSINLVGEDRDTTIIDGGGVGDVVYVSADWVSISGFTIQNGGSGGSGYDQDTGMQVNSNQNVINNNNIISNGRDGILLYSSSNNIISNNSISSNDDDALILYNSNNNNISDNSISSNDDNGIIVYTPSNGNTISGNTISSNNDDGIYIDGSSNNIYHNNIIGNARNAYDECSNSWDNGYPSGGNYWSDYTGTDGDGDGIGDTPYNIPGGSNQDNYPLMTLYGPPHAEFEYTKNDRTVTFDASLSYDYNGNIISYNWDFGDGEEGTGEVVSYTYGNYGKYTVTLDVTDDDGLTDNISKGVIVSDEIPPEISNVQAIPPIQIPGGYVNISTFVVDNVGLSGVRLVIRYPDYHWENISILQNKTEDTYYCNRTYDMIGIYACHIWAIDTSGNSATSPFIYFEITEEFVASAGGPYSGWVNTPLQFNGYAVGGVPPYSWHWDFGDGNTSNMQNPVHTYTAAGNFTVALTVTDDEDNTASDTTWALIEDINHRPDKPIIDGATSGKPGTEYEYTFNAVDPDGDNVKYHIDWDDGDSDTTAFSSSGTDVKVKHTWSEEGTYTITAYAEDTNGLVGPEGTLSVTMPRNRATQTPVLTFLQNHPILFQLLQRFLNL